MKMQIYR